MTIQELFNLAVSHHQAGRLREAEQLYRQILEQQPNHAEATNFLGLIAHHAGRTDEALQLIRRSIQLKPDYAAAHGNLGNILKSSGQIDLAIAAYQTLVALRPNLPEAYYNLGSALKDAMRLDEAVTAYRRAIALRPDYADAYNNLGTTLACKGDVDDAILAYERAIKSRPDFFEAICNLGNARRDQRRLDEAITLHQRAIVLRPNAPEGHNNLAIALRSKGLFDEAIREFRAAISLREDAADAHGNLAIALTDMGRLDEALAECRREIALRPSSASAHSHLLYAMHFSAQFGPAATAQEHRDWNARHAEHLKAECKAHENIRDPDRPLRVGYVSPDFSDHPVGRFLLPLLANHDRNTFKVFAYSNAHAHVADGLTARLRGYTDAWRDIAGQSDEQTAVLIRRDRIDILVDLAGHTGNSRLLVFARKPAPVQVTYLGYPDTTGLTTMDYRLTDVLADPPGQTEQFHSEQLFRLSPSAWCFQPVQSAPIVPREEAAITFGCFNTFAKVNEQTLRQWSRILLAVPESRLLLKSVALGSVSVRQSVEKFLGALGIAAHRLELRGNEASYASHMALYGKIDIALDTFPYHGTTTTCEAMWMGVPVVTFAGETHASRVGVSLLNNVGLPELITESPEEYVRIAVQLAHDRSKLAQLRSTLRSRMEGSVLMNAAFFASGIEAAYRQMWRTWCSRKTNKS